MSKLLTSLVALILAAGALTLFAGTASADWGEWQGSGLSLDLLGTPAIDLINCDDGQIAKWGKPALSFRINNLHGLDASTIAGVRAGVVSWNKVGGPYTLVETTSTTADITVNVRKSIGNGLGYASGVCRKGSTGMEKVTIEIGAQGLGKIGSRNVAAHETGHALGLGHSNRTGDLMHSNFSIVVSNLKAACASNLDVGALSATREPYTVLFYSAPLLCQ